MHFMAVIGITTVPKLEDYRQSILHIGGEVRMLDVVRHRSTRALDGVDGLMLTGGGDVMPARYGEAPHPTVTESIPRRDDFEIGLDRSRTRREQLPILAICRGIQVLNVACGGTLVQDIPSQVPGALEHSLHGPPTSPYALAHEVWIEKDSLLVTLMRRPPERDSCEVNSRHHQAVKQVAPGFSVSATAPDGVIEAIEDPAARFCLGVQWHPGEFFAHGRVPRAL